MINMTILELKLLYFFAIFSDPGRGSDNPAFIWFCDFLSKASRLSCDYQSRALCLSDGTSATPHVFMKDIASRGKGSLKENHHLWNRHKSLFLLINVGNTLFLKEALNEMRSFAIGPI